MEKVIKSIVNKKVGSFKFELPSGTDFVSKMRANIKGWEKEFSSQWANLKSDKERNELIESYQSRARDTIKTLAEKSDLVVSIDGKSYWLGGK